MLDYFRHSTTWWCSGWVSDS